MPHASTMRPAETSRLERLAADSYDRCHPDDSFDDLVRRSPFSKEDRRLLEDWLEAVRGMAPRR